MAHTHRCSRCNAAIPCSGYRVDNYDGIPPVLCSVEADMAHDEPFICEECFDAKCKHGVFEGDDCEHCNEAAGERQSTFHDAATPFAENH